jgi:hypothetical protein
MLARKRELERLNMTANNMIPFDRWIADALELILRIELGRI